MTNSTLKTQNATLAIAALLLLAGLALVGVAVRGALVPRVRVLFIGNSHTFVNDLPGQLTALASQAGEQPLATETVAVGGATLRDHWQQGRALERIRAGGWDYVVLQDQSQRPLLDPEGMAADVRRFDEEIRKAGARTVLYITWTHQAEQRLQRQITAAYRRIAAERGALVAPVGPAWQEALRRQPRLALYQPDQIHAAPAGTYLAAYVFYATLFGRSPAGLDAPRAGDIFTAEQRSVAQQAAWSAAQAGNTPQRR
ncbi:MAG TPA: SGNH/GDSL hydrolase family protein [Roseiflexaceae bacterium]|nr:SGNH/GDSL hydrolase family protein [Roseiflexaceae bacterium]